STVSGAAGLRAVSQPRRNPVVRRAQLRSRMERWYRRRTWSRRSTEVRPRWRRRRRERTLEGATARCDGPHGTGAARQRFYSVEEAPERPRAGAIVPGRGGRTPTAAPTD